MILKPQEGDEAFAFFCTAPPASVCSHFFNTLAPSASPHQPDFGIEIIVMK